MLWAAAQKEVNMQQASEEAAAEKEVQQALEEAAAEKEAKVQQAAYLRELDKIANKLTKLKIYASRGTDGRWQVHRPDGTVLILGNNSDFHDYANNVLQE